MQDCVIIFEINTVQEVYIMLICSYKGCIYQDHQKKIQIEKSELLSKVLHQFNFDSSKYSVASLYFNRSIKVIEVLAAASNFLHNPKNVITYHILRIIKWVMQILRRVCKMRPDRTECIWSGLRVLLILHSRFSVRTDLSPEKSRSDRIYIKVILKRIIFTIFMYYLSKGLYISYF